MNSTGVSLPAADTTSGATCGSPPSGPFVERTVENDGDRFRAFRPVYSYTEDEAAGRARWEIVWPLATYEAISSSRGRPGFSPRSTRISTVTIPDPGRGSGSCPSTTRDATRRCIRTGRCGRSGVRFTSSSARTKSTSPCGRSCMTTRQNDMEGRHFLWPLVSRTTGDGVERFRVFPFYARAYRENRHHKTTFTCGPSIPVRNSTARTHTAAATWCSRSGGTSGWTTRRPGMSSRR